MAVTLKASAQPSASIDFALQVQIAGYTGLLSNVWVVIGVNNAAAPVLYSDLTIPEVLPLLYASDLAIVRQAGRNTIAQSGDWAFGGTVSPGDKLYVALVISTASPVGTDPLVAVSGPITVDV